MQNKCLLISLSPATLKLDADACDWGSETPTTLCALVSLAFAIIFTTIIIRVVTVISHIVIIILNAIIIARLCWRQDHNQKHIQSTNNIVLAMSAPKG